MSVGAVMWSSCDLWKQTFLVGFVFSPSLPCLFNNPSQPNTLEDNLGHTGNRSCIIQIWLHVREHLKLAGLEALPHQFTCQYLSSEVDFSDLLPSDYTLQPIMLHEKDVRPNPTQHHASIATCVSHHLILFDKGVNITTTTK